MEAWGGATYDVALRFLSEDPWECSALLRNAMPNIPSRCSCAVATPSGTRRTRPRSRTPSSRRPPHRARHLPHLRLPQRRRPDAPRRRGRARDRHRRRRGRLCYTGNLLDPREELYTLDYYLRLAEEIVGTGAHVLAIKDMAGLLRAPAATRLVRAWENFDLPVHLHTHDTAGGQIGTLLAAIDAGVDAVDAACSSMAGTTSQPSLSALVAATDGTERPTGLDIDKVFSLEPYWEAVRQLYKPFESGLASPRVASTSTRSPAGSCPTCASRPSPSGSATASRTSRTCMPPPTGSWATSSR